MADCSIGEINENFVLNPNITYKTKSIDLYGTCNRFERSKLSEKKMVTLVKAMAKTNLKDTLRRVHVYEEEFPEDELQKIFNKFDFKVEVIGDEHQPVEMS